LETEMQTGKIGWLIIIAIPILIACYQRAARKAILCPQ